MLYCHPPVTRLHSVLCSVGGLDYSTVRTAAFMGLRLLSEAADTLQRQGSHRLPPQQAPRTPANNGACNGDAPPPPAPIGTGNRCWEPQLILVSEVKAEAKLLEKR